MLKADTPDDKALQIKYVADLDAILQRPIYLPKKQLKGICKGVADFGSSKLRLYNEATGNAVDIKGGFYAAAAGTFQEAPTKTNFQNSLRISEEAAEEHQANIKTLQLGSFFVNSEADIRNWVGADYKIQNEKSDPVVRLEETPQDERQHFSSTEIFVFGGGPAYHRAAFLGRPPISNLEDRIHLETLDLVIASAHIGAMKDVAKGENKEKSDADKNKIYGKSFAVVFQAVAAQLLQKTMVARLLEKAGVEPGKASEAIIFETSGGSNHGFGIEYKGEADSLCVDSTAIKAMAKDLAKAVADFPNTGPNREAVCALLRSRVNSSFINGMPAQIPAPGKTLKIVGEAVQILAEGVQGGGASLGGGAAFSPASTLQWQRKRQMGPENRFRERKDRKVEENQLAAGTPLKKGGL